MRQKLREAFWYFYDDSDVYKALEGIAYSLINNPNPELEKKADEWINKMAAAQLPDGYINTFIPLLGWINVGQIWISMRCIVLVI